MNQLFHLSFREDLEGTWYPRSPYSQLTAQQRTPIDIVKLDYDDPIAEPDEPRISFSPSIEQCFQAIYCNVKHYFIKEKYPYIDMYVYVPIITENTIIETPIELTTGYKVWDAFYTEEHWITTPTEMKIHSKVRIYNTIKTGHIEIYPFNDKTKAKQGEKYFISPKLVLYDDIIR